LLVISMTSNDAFFASLEALIESWCDRRALGPLGEIPPSYLVFTD